MHIITVQHTQAEHHVNGMVGGSSDWPLTARGRRHARKIARQLRRQLGRKPDYLLYSSDMLRTRQTAAPIAAALGLELNFVPELRELSVGSAAGKSRAWFKEHKTLRQPGESFLDYRPLPDAETYRELNARVSKFFGMLLAQGKNAIVVGHGGSLEQFLCCFLRLEPAQVEQLWLCGSPGGVTSMRVDENGKHILERWNQ